MAVPWCPDKLIFDNEVAPEWLIWAYASPAPDHGIVDVLSEKMAALSFESAEYLADATVVLARHGGCDVSDSFQKIRGALQVDILIARPRIVLPPVPESQCLNLLKILTNFAENGMTFSKTGDELIFSTIRTVLSPENAASISLGETPYDALENEAEESSETVIAEAAVPTLGQLIKKFSPFESREPLFLVALYISLAEMWHGKPPPIRVGVDGAVVLEDSTVMLHVFGRKYPDALISGIGDGKTIYHANPNEPYFVPTTIIHLLRAAGADDWLSVIENPKSAQPGTTLYTWSRSLV
jgi:hypothetical protein